MNMVHKVQKEHGQLHDEVRVVDIRSLTLPSPWMVQIPQMDGVPERCDGALSGHDRRRTDRVEGGDWHLAKMTLTTITMLQICWAQTQR